MQPRSTEEELERPEYDKRRDEQHREYTDETDGEVLADLGRVGDAVGDEGEAAENESEGEDLDGILDDPVDGAGDDVLVEFVDRAAQDEDGTDAADIEQRRQREEQRGEHARTQAGEDGVRVEGVGPAAR